MRSHDDRRSAAHEPLPDVLLVPPVISVLQSRYRRYRHHHASPVARDHGVLHRPELLFYEFESPSWQRVSGQRARWYPQLSADRPKLADPLRYLLQSLWLMTHHSSNGLRERFTYTRWPQRLRDRFLRLAGSAAGDTVEQNPLGSQIGTPRQHHERGQNGC